MAEETNSKNRKKLYLSGKITGNPDYRNEFAFAKQFYEDQGYSVLDPSMLPQDGMSNADYMRVCMAMLDTADEVAFLPGYSYSDGAKLEEFYYEYVTAKNKDPHYAGVEYVDAANDILKSVCDVSEDYELHDAFCRQLQTDAAKLFYYAKYNFADIVMYSGLDANTVQDIIDREHNKSNDCNYDKLDRRLTDFVELMNRNYSKMVYEFDKEAKAIRRMIQGKFPYKYLCEQEKTTGSLARGCDSMRLEKGVAYCSDHITTCCYCREADE